ncbi:nSTAND1 domain-containing NTPase [Nitrospira sp. Nam80]
MPKIFVSHSSINNASALALARWLEEQGWDDYFLDITPTRGLSPGERWQAALKKAADRCEAVLFLISPAWRDSKWCLAEFLLAKQLGKTIFGAMVETTPLDTLAKEMTSEWQLANLVDGVERQFYQVHDDPLVPETVISFAKAGLARLRIGLQKAGLGALSFAWPPEHERDRCPYRGLKPLEAEDAAVFFGREAAIIDGLDTLRTIRERGVEHLLVILGASGAGKSSFLRAGLWPRLRRDDRHFLVFPVIRPGRAALTGSTGLIASLEVVLREYKIQSTRAEIRECVREPGTLRQLIKKLQDCAFTRLAHQGSVPTVVIPIDQGEELFIADGCGEAEHLSWLLADVLGTQRDEPSACQTSSTAITIVAIRSDSYEQLQTEPRLQSLKSRLFNLKPMSRAEFKGVIEGPAARASASGRKLWIEPALTERLLHDAEGADVLPLLGFMLERLYVEHGSDGDLRLIEYESLGGMRGSIEEAVKTAFADPARVPVIPEDHAQRTKLVRQAFIPWLADVDPDTKKPKRRVARWDEFPPETHAVLERFIGARLLLRDRRFLNDVEGECIVVEIAHEAFLRQWPTLATWLLEDADHLRVLEGVTRSAAEWDNNVRADAWLTHTGSRLEAAEELQNRFDFYRRLGDIGRKYLMECRLQENVSQREKEQQLQKQLELERARAEAAEQAQREADNARIEAAKREEAEKARVEEQNRRVAAQKQATRRLVGGLLIGAVIFLVASLFWYQARSHAFDRLIGLGSILVKNLAHNVRYGIIIEERTILDQFIDGVMDVDGVVYVMISGGDGQVLAAKSNGKVLDSRGNLRDPQRPVYPYPGILEIVIKRSDEPVITKFQTSNDTGRETIFDFAVVLKRRETGVNLDALSLQAEDYGRYRTEDTQQSHTYGVVQIGLTARGELFDESLESFFVNLANYLARTNDNYDYGTYP